MIVIVQFIIVIVVVQLTYSEVLTGNFDGFLKAHGHFNFQTIVLTYSY